MSNSTTSLIAEIMTNSQNENMAKLILDIKKKKNDFGIKKNMINKGTSGLTEINEAIVKSPIYLQIREVIKKKQPTFYWIDEVGGKKVIFLKKGDKPVRMYELGAPSISTGLPSANANVQSNILNIQGICALLYEIVQGQVQRSGNGREYRGIEFMEQYVYVLISYIDECPDIGLEEYIQRELGEHTPAELFYTSMRANPDIEDIMGPLEDIVVSTKESKCALAGGSKKRKVGGSPFSKSLIIKQIQNEMKKGSRGVSITLPKSIANTFKKIKLNKTFKLQMITPLQNEAVKSRGGRYDAFKRKLDRYITNIDPVVNNSIQTTPVGNVHYIDFDLGDDQVSKNIEKNVINGLRADPASLNAQLLEFIQKSKIKNNNKTFHTELKKFIQKYVYDLKLLIEKGSRIGNQNLFLPLDPATEQNMRNTGLPAFSSTEYRLYQYYAYFYRIFFTYLNTEKATYPFQLPLQNKRAVQQILQFILIRLTRGGIDMGTNTDSNIKNRVFELPQVVKYLHRYYREKMRIDQKKENRANPLVDMNILEIEKSDDSFYHAVFASLYSRNYLTPLNGTQFLTWIGQNPEGFDSGRGPATAIVVNIKPTEDTFGVGDAIAVGAPDAPNAASRAQLTEFNNKLNVGSILRLNADIAVGAGAGAGAAALKEVPQPPSVRWMIGNDSSGISPDYGAGGNKIFQNVFNILTGAKANCEHFGKLANDNANNAFLRYREWFVGQLRKMIGDRLTAPNSVVFDHYLKEIIQKIRDMLLKANAKSTRNVQNIIKESKDPEILKYKDTFFGKSFKTLRDIPNDLQLENPAEFNRTKGLVQRAIIAGAKACELEFCILETLVQSTICNVGFLDVKNYISDIQDKQNSFILMANGIYPQIKSCKITQKLANSILIISDDSTPFHYHAVIKGNLSGTKKERCEMMQGLAPETIISYDNIRVAYTGFNAVKETGGDRTVAALNAFYTKLITNPIVDATQGINNTGGNGNHANGVDVATQNIGITASKTVRGTCTGFADFVYDPSNGQAWLNTAILGTIDNGHAGATNPDGLEAVVINGGFANVNLARLNVNA